MPFATLGLSPVLCTHLPRLGFARPTPIQSHAIPLILSRRDLVARAQTGTGKTAAFALPMIERLMVSEPRPRQTRCPRGLVLVPTRELAVQVHDAIGRHGSEVSIRAAAIYGGAPMSGQVRALQGGTDIVVATPGRLLDHVRRRTIDLSRVEILTLDEADRMLDMGFLPALRAIVGELPKSRQTLLFSATLSGDVVRLSQAFTRDPLRVDLSDGHTVAPTVTHSVYPVGDGHKSDLLLHILGNPPVEQALVFCRTKRQANRVGEHLTRAGVAAAVIHGNKSQTARSRALGDFTRRRVTTLVATDVAARGIDIAQLPLVINYDLPLVANDYIHRVGRTGRAGCEGRAISLVSAAERGLVRDIERLLGAPLQQVVGVVADTHNPVARDRRPTSVVADRVTRRTRRPDRRGRPHAPGKPSGSTASQPFRLS